MSLSKTDTYSLSHVLGEDLTSAVKSRPNRSDCEGCEDETSFFLDTIFDAKTKIACLLFIVICSVRQTMWVNELCTRCRRLMLWAVMPYKNWVAVVQSAANDPSRYDVDRIFGDERTDVTKCSCMEIAPTNHSKNMIVECHLSTKCHAENSVWL